MTYRTRVQQIVRRGGGQFYMPVPADLARRLGLRKGEAAEWSVGGRGELSVRLERAPEQGSPAGEKSAIAAGRG